mgnify:CR=1 FL=1
MPKIIVNGINNITDQIIVEVVTFSFPLFFILKVNGQDSKSPGIISGNIQTIGQYYQEDTIINAALSKLAIEIIEAFEFALKKLKRVLISQW